MKQQPEFTLQCQIAEFMRRQFPQVPFLSDVRAALKLTIPQQLRQKKTQAADFAMPDMVVFGDGRTMFLELKAKSPFKQNGEIYSDEHLQRQYRDIQMLRTKGFDADFYWELDAAIHAIKRFLR